MGTGKFYPLKVSSAGKQSVELSNCHRQNALVNRCATSTTRESLYSDGHRNPWHYYWCINWFATPAGPLAVSMENGVADVYLLDLEPGKKVLGFHRALGVSQVDAEQSPDGAVTVVAGLGFEQGRIDNAAVFLRDNAPAPDRQ
jgi:hypothetical protein